MKLVFATNNANKVMEIQQLLGDTYKLQSLEDIGCTEDIEETGTTLHENAAIKSRYVYEHFGLDCFADDTGLLVQSLNDEPGVYSARYAGPQKNAGDNMDLLLHKLQHTGERSARFVTVISLMLSGNEYVFEGELHGHIIHEKRGTQGFGYDPVFVPEGDHRSLAELSMEEKNRISHRARAFRKLIAFLQEQKISY